MVKDDDIYVKILTDILASKMKTDTEKMDRIRLYIAIRDEECAEAEVARIDNMNKKVFST